MSTLGDVQLSVDGDVVVARLAGEIDLSNARAIEEAVVVSTPNDASAVALDLSPLDYLDSSGIQLIYQLREKLRTRGQSLLLVIPAGSPAADALRLAGVMDHLPISETVTLALEAHNSQEPASTPGAHTRVS